MAVPVKVSQAIAYTISDRPMKKLIMINVKQTVFGKFARDDISKLLKYTDRQSRIAAKRFTAQTNKPKSIGNVNKRRSCFSSPK